MAYLTAHRLRDRAREAMLGAGGRGFMRFAPQGDALLATDAARRCLGGAALARLEEAFLRAGFSAVEQDGLLLLTPQDALLEQGAEEADRAETDWANPEHPAQALAARWLACGKEALTPDGRRLIVDTLRLTGTPGLDVLDGLGALRAHAAVMLRKGDRSGMHIAGAILTNWCEREGLAK